MTTYRNDLHRLSNYKTTVSTINGLLTCIYVSTAIVQEGKGKLILNSGGYQTVTTKKKMNQFANQYLNGAFSVYQVKFEWFVDYRGFTFEFSDNMDLVKEYNKALKEQERERNHNDSIEVA
ncbi:MAG: hypothetical protein KAT90_14880 [Gammaproteobacteria bacterium]|nr:hypothetical protein [Gammaproteobacteria bacterium]